MCSTILVAIRRHRSVRSIGAVPLCVCLVAHMCTWWSCWPRLDHVSHTPYVHHAVYAARITSAGSVSRLGGLAHLVCMERATRHMPLMVPLRLQAVREDHFGKIS